MLTQIMSVLDASKNLEIKQDQLNVLKQQLQKRPRSIAIFYGAAHMHDFDQRLRKDFQLQPTETVWLEAWNLREPAE